VTTQLPSRERPQTEAEYEHPDVLFEEAHRRRRRRWMAGSALIGVTAIAGALLLGMGGGGGGSGGGAGGRAHGQPSGSGSGAGSGHASSSALLGGVPSTQRYSTSAGAACPLAPRSRYLPPWSGCVSVMVADVRGDGRRDLVLTYSRLRHFALHGLPPRSTAPHKDAALYPALQAMLRVVTPDGHMVTVPIHYQVPQPHGRLGLLYVPAAAALISVAHVNDLPGKEIFVQVGQISSGSTAVAYSLYRGQLINSGAVLAYGGDGGTRATFQCVAGNPQQLLQRTFELINVTHEPIYGLWKETTATYRWQGRRLVRTRQSTVKRDAAPRDSIGAGCTRGVT
jgi:hypothetical protein